MPQNLDNSETLSLLRSVHFDIGNFESLSGITELPPLFPFNDRTIEFLNTLSKNLMSDREAKDYPEITAFAFWIRKSSMLHTKERFEAKERHIRLGRSILFHIAPSNVPVNYAYSLVSGLITGNANIVRIPSRNFPQVKIINDALNETLNSFPELTGYIQLVRYERNQEINDFFSSIADIRVIWGGDRTIAEIRKSPLRPRATEVTFSDRYSMAVIDSDCYMKIENKKRFAESFYNDTYLTDQNACTSPRIVIWTGKQIQEAKEIFWRELHQLVKERYRFQPIMSVNKLTSAYRFAASHDRIRIEPSPDNYIVRINVSALSDDLMDYRESTGYFFEYDCGDILDLKPICDNVRCQTIGYLGSTNEIVRLLTSGIKGVDRVVPIGKTMDFDLIWDGYNLFERFTRIIAY